MADRSRRAPRRAAARWWLIGLGGRLIGREWLIAVAFSVGLASLGAALGIFPDLAVEGTHTDRMRWLYVFAAVAVVFLTVGVALWAYRNWLLHKRGTAYIVRESSPGWKLEEIGAFLSAVRAQFAAVHHIPGPADLGADWTWPLDARTDEWDHHLDQLVLAFWATQFNDDHDTDNALFVWAPWSVALAFGLRTSVNRRGLNLHVRQRPSFDGRIGTVIPPGFHQSGHTFRTGTVTALSGTASEHHHEVTLRTRTRQVDPAPQATAATRPPTVLLLRTSTQPFGLLTATPAAGRVDLPLLEGAGLGLPAHAQVSVHEWRYLPRTGSIIDWDEYPAVALAAADWLCQRATDAAGSTLLLGALLPPEVAVGLGIHAATRSDWPTALWPIVHVRPGQPQVVPRLNLGRPETR